MIDVKILTIGLGILLFLYLTPVGPEENLVKVEGIYFNVSREDFFDFITDPDVFNKWFQWISRASHADHKLLGTGKKYDVKFLRGHILFEVKNLTKNSEEISIMLDANTWAKPTFKLKVIETCSQSKYYRLKLFLELNFKRTSLLFRMLVGCLLQRIAKEKMLESLDILEMVVNNFKVISISKSF